MRPLALVLLMLPALAWGRTVSIPVGDDAPLRAEVSGQGARAVVLVHDDAGQPADWDELRERLAARGFQVAAVALRGSAARDAAGWTQAADDVAAAVAWLRAQGATEVTVVGAGLGGNAALHVAAADATTRGAVLVAPRLSAPGLSVTADLGALGARPLLLVASTGDATSVRAAQALASKAVGVAQVEVVDAPSTGARLLLDVPRLEGALVTWLSSPPGESVAARPKSALAEGEVHDLETTGTKYDR